MKKLSAVMLAMSGILFIALPYTSNTATKSVKSPRALEPLVADTGVEKIFKLSKQDQFLVLAAVRRYCVEQYHAESCIHHLATCGDPCLAEVPRATRRRVLADYQAVRRAHGLPAIRPL